MKYVTATDKNCFVRDFSHLIRMAFYMSKVVREEKSSCYGMTIIYRTY